MGSRKGSDLACVSGLPEGRLSVGRSGHLTVTQPQGDQRGFRHPLQGSPSTASWPRPCKGPAPSDISGGCPLGPGSASRLPVRLDAFGSASTLRAHAHAQAPPPRQRLRPRLQALQRSDSVSLSGSVSRSAPGSPPHPDPAPLFGPLTAPPPRRWLRAARVPRPVPALGSVRCSAPPRALGTPRAPGPARRSRAPAPALPGRRRRGAPAWA